MSQKLQIEYLPTDQLQMYDGNANIHTAHQIDQIAESIEEFDFSSPILAWHNEDGEAVIVAGHGRLMAARKLGIDELPVVFLDHMTDEQRRAFTIVENQLTRLSEFDMGILEVELENITNIDMSQFDFDVELDDDVFDEGDEEVEEDEVPDDAPSIVQKGDVWQLGRHRLMCGDSTDTDSVSRLMDGNRADVCFTSPPYNMSAGNVADMSAMGKVYLRGGSAYKTVTDDMSDTDYADFICNALDNALSFCDDALFNIGILAHSKYGIVEMLHRNVSRFCDVIVWKKSKAFTLGLPSQKGLLNHPCEYIYCFNQSGTRSFSHPQWKIGNGTNVIETNNAAQNEYAKEHNATFPVEFASEVVRNFTDKSVLDLFGGTGTTLIAAEQLGRTCYMMELDPHYCDIIIERWQNLTGETARKVEQDG